MKMKILADKTVFRRSFPALLAVGLALGLAVATLAASGAGQAAGAQAVPQAQNSLYFPVVYNPFSPAGSYDCVEYEFGLIWAGEVITLGPHGTSTYEYLNPNTDILTGTWTYTSATHEVGFTGFRWPTATYQIPDSLWASRYLTQTGFEIALSCKQR